jgi:hypothetical protein
MKGTCQHATRYTLQVEEAGLTAAPYVPRKQKTAWARSVFESQAILIPVVYSNVARTIKEK